MTYPHGQEPPPRMYFGNGKEEVRQTRSGDTFEVIRYGVHRKELVAAIQFIDERGTDWFNYDIKRSMQIGRNGQTHYGEVDTRPRDNAPAQRPSARPAPTAPRTFAPVAPRQPEPDAPDAEDDIPF